MAILEIVKTSYNMDFIDYYPQYKEITHEIYNKLSLFITQVQQAFDSIVSPGDYSYLFLF